MKGQTQKEMKQDVNSKRDEEKQEVMRKGWKKNLMKENLKIFCFERDSFFKIRKSFSF